MDQEPEAAGEIEEKMDQEEEMLQNQKKNSQRRLMQNQRMTQRWIWMHLPTMLVLCQIDRCSLKDKSMLALYERIEIMEEDGIPLTKANAEALIEEAADKAEKPSLGKRIKGLFSSKYDKDGLLILKEEHLFKKILFLKGKI